MIAFSSSLTPTLNTLRSRSTFPALSHRITPCAAATKRVGAAAPSTVAGKPLSASDQALYKKTFVDEDATSALNIDSSFPFSASLLVDMARLLLLRNLGVEDASLLDDSFTFVAPVVGPLGKDEFLKAFASFDLGAAFPDSQAGIHHLRVDPFLPSRVFYSAQFIGKHDGPLGNTVEATGIEVETPPQTSSFTFNSAGLCTKLTVGYVMDKQVGNTGGLGGVFGLFYAVGSPLPFREGKPFRPSWQYSLSQKFSNLLSRFQKS